MDNTVKFKNRFMPNQPEVAHLYKGSDILSDIYVTIAENACIIDPWKELKLTLSDKFSIPEMSSNPIMLRFLEVLALIRKPKEVLEIGTFLGVSAMHLAMGLPHDSHVTTIEKFDHFAAIARKNIADNGFDNRITVLEGDAFELIPEYAKNKTFDMVFLDGNKERYRGYFKMLAPYVSEGGLFITDDIFFHGDSLNAEPQTEKGKGVKQLLDKIRDDSNWRKVILPISNGLLIMVKQMP